MICEASHFHSTSNMISWSVRTSLSTIFTGHQVTWRLLQNIHKSFSRLVKGGGGIVFVIINIQFICVLIKAEIMGRLIQKGIW